MSKSWKSKSAKILEEEENKEEIDDESEVLKTTPA
jgi:hypothetical protein